MALGGLPWTRTARRRPWKLSGAPCLFTLLPVLGSQSSLPFLPIYRLKVVFVLFCLNHLVMELRVDPQLRGLERGTARTAPARRPARPRRLVDTGMPVALPPEASLLLFWGPWSPQTHTQQKNKL